ncbi:ComF family protein [Saccharomonospora piscinae]|uniref:ComF family protein n=1 Tax=Saccharomonospora piscinae TaxID=687388 RepID=UPI001106E110|nr:phosphoribosyltransferase family protein [Saccharomonospora piscinae]TLW91907.1 ComF family protein [Saccharomonospora piscinae]
METTATADGLTAGDRIGRPGAGRSGWRGVLTATLDLLWPSSCAACGRAGPAACEVCLAELARAPLALRPGVSALARHDGAAREFVLAYKEHGRRDLARPLGRALAAVVPLLDGARPDADGTWWLVPVPSRPAASRMRGGPHVRALARECAHALAHAGEPVAVAPALRLSARARDAVGLGRAARVANLAGRVTVTRAGLPPPGTPVVLIDDVVTTGATLTACTRALFEAGVEVGAAVTLTGAGAVTG